MTFVRSNLRRSGFSLPLYPVLVVGDVFSVEELIGGRVFSQFVLRRRTGVHEGLSHHGEAGVRDAVLMDVKHKLWVFDDVHPKAQRKTAEDDR